MCRDLGSCHATARTVHTSVIQCWGRWGKPVYTELISRYNTQVICVNRSTSQESECFSRNRKTLHIITHTCSNYRTGTNEGRKEMFYLTMHSTHLIFLRLYGVGHMVKDHSDSKRGNPLAPHRLLFPISSKGSFICTIPQTE